MGTTLVEAQNAIRKAIKIIEDADRLAEAADGPVLHVRDVMTDSEWRELYLVLKNALRD